MSEEVLEKIEKQKKKVSEVIMSCELFLQRFHDLCNDICPVYEFCWSLQDLDEDVGKGLENMLREEP